MTLRSVKLEVAETTAGIEVRWSATHDGKDHHGTMKVPPLTAHAYILCQALYQAEAMIGELGAVDDAAAPAGAPVPPKATAEKSASRQMGLAL